MPSRMGFDWTTSFFFATFAALGFRAFAALSLFRVVRFFAMLLPSFKRGSIRECSDRPERARADPDSPTERAPARWARERCPSGMPARRAPESWCARARRCRRGWRGARRADPPARRQARWAETAAASAWWSVRRNRSRSPLAEERLQPAEPLLRRAERLPVVVDAAA